MAGDAGHAHGWTTLAGLRAQSLKAWNRGGLLRELLEPSGVYPRRRPLKRPTAAELLSDYGAVRAWAAELSAAAGAYGLETVEVGRRTVGSNRIPAAAVFPTVEDEIGFVGKGREAAQFGRLAADLGGLEPLLLGWAARRPLKLLELGADALTAARVALWLRDNPEPGIYVRQLSLPGVHTKFIEQHRQVIDQLQAAVGPVSAIQDADVDDVSVEDPPAGFAATDAALEEGAGRTPAARFARRHGFMHPPELVRFRLLDPDLDLFGGARDITVTAEAFSSLRLPVETVIATENQVNFLALPEQPGCLALYGGGYGFTSLRHTAWLRGCRVLYWGDIDTHGFRILDQLRAVHPHVESVLMDAETLLAHRDRWGSEPTPSKAQLTKLTAGEKEVYEALCNDSYGKKLRLEQEQVTWDWALKRLR
ncbi:Wadjet anti-phage system protein JetD domain-containing protein [Arthrobacter sp. UYEF21]|uniref:Wadjet anti-phage system protein JetD domain-containing protein n=1 Tax=Arthrobacter sp. UYEF21 TaxID=1756364 RepID=UPI003398D202